MKSLESHKAGFPPLPTLFGNPFRIPTLPRPRRRVRCLGATAKTSHNLNSSPQLRKGLVTHVPGPKCNECSGTLISQERLVSLFGAERMRLHFVVAVARDRRCGQVRGCYHTLWSVESSLSRLASWLTAS